MEKKQINCLGLVNWTINTQYTHGMQPLLYETWKNNCFPLVHAVRDIKVFADSPSNQG